MAATARRRAALTRGDVDIDAAVSRYIDAREGTARFASFDYCFNYFRSFYESGTVEDLAAPERLQMSCLQLGFYLASWGMYRGSAELRHHSAKGLAPVIDAIVAAPTAVWSVDADDYGPEVQAVLFDVYRQLRAVLPGGQSQTLVTKTMLGVFGCVPAFDRFFCDGFGVSTFGAKSLTAIGAYYQADIEAIERCRVPTLDFGTGAASRWRYTRAKVIDMVFFTEGLARSSGNGSTTVPG